MYQRSSLRESCGNLEHGALAAPGLSTRLTTSPEVLESSLSNYKSKLWMVLHKRVV